MSRRDELAALLGRAGGEASPPRVVAATAGPLAAASALIAGLGAARVMARQDIAASIGASSEGVRLAVVLGAVAAAFGAAALAAAAPRRTLAAGALGVCAAATALGALTTGIPWLVAALAAAGIAAGSVPALHWPMLMDAVEGRDRLAAFSWHHAAAWSGAAAAAAISGASDFTTWRGVWLLVALPAPLAGALVLGTQDHPRGMREGGVLAGSPSPGGRGPGRPYGVADGFRRVAQCRGARPVLAGHAALGMLAATLIVTLPDALEERRVAADGRAWLMAAMALAGAAGAVATSPQNRGAAGMVRRSGQLAAVAALFSAVGALAGPLPVAVAAYALCFGLAGAAGPGLALAAMSLAPPSARGHAGALAAAASAGGFVVALATADAFGSRFGLDVGLFAASLPVLHAAAVAFRHGPASVDADISRVVGELVDDQELSEARRRGTRPDLLSCRGIDFSYDSVQVLFGVDFTVREGEAVALLGTNGAGKSTLLRVASGLGTPDAGTVRWVGEDITLVEAERRVRLGIAQVTGGRATFGPLTVLESLRVAGYSHGRDRVAVDAGIEASFDAFPALAARREQRASTLSGGEQQMLALSKALILRPRLLLIDELSLGLAPRVVTELLAMVRRINASGTAVVLVEQSVAVAAQAVEHAYFMEKGEIRFDGAASDLLRRPDLLRSVFLRGAAHALAE